MKALMQYTGANWKSEPKENGMIKLDAKIVDDVPKAPRTVKREDLPCLACREDYPGVVVLLYGSMTKLVMGVTVSSIVNDYIGRSWCMDEIGAIWKPYRGAIQLSNTFEGNE